MKNKFNTRKGVILLAQVAAALTLVSVLVLSQIGAFAGSGKSSPINSSAPQVTPTMLTASQAPQATAPAPPEETVAPESGELFNGNTSGNGRTSAYLACESQLKGIADAMHAANNQSTQLWAQINSLRNSASASSDPTEAAALNAQADALQPEADRVSNLGTQLWQQLFQGHRGVSCGPDGPVYND